MVTIPIIHFRGTKNSLQKILRPIYVHVQSDFLSLLAEVLRISEVVLSYAEMYIINRRFETQRRQDYRPQITGSIQKVF